MFFRAALIVCSLVMLALFAASGCTPPADSAVTLTPASVTAGSCCAGVAEVGGGCGAAQQAPPGTTAAP